MKNSGFSFVELLISLVILTILLVFAIPFSFSLYQKHQLKLLETEITTGLRYAKNIALLYELPLALTPLPGANDFSCGMILFIDNEKHHYNNEALVHLWRWQCKNVEISWKGFQSDNYLLFASNLENTTANGHFDLKVNQFKTSLVVNRYGRIDKA